MPTGETISPPCGGCAPLFSAQSHPRQIAEILLEEDGTLGLRDCFGLLLYDAHHVMPRPRFRSLSFISETGGGSVSQQAGDSLVSAARV